MKKCTVWYQNMRGVKSKFDSLLEKVEEYEPAILCLTETHLLEKETFEIDGYNTELRNDRDNFGGGIVIAVSKKIEHICTIVEKGKEPGETLWVVIDNGRVQIRLGVLYAPQESRTTLDEYEILYKQLNYQLEQAKERNQKVLLLGDFNCKIGNKIRGNKPDISKSGKMLLSMVKKHKMVLLNSLGVCSGLWTREEGESKSVLDYVMMWEADEKAVRYMEVDESGEKGPCSYKEDKITFSDHNVMTMEIDWLLL